jgi:site-specific recombinase XerC
MDATDMHLAAYERSLRAKGRSPKTIQGYLEALRQLKLFAAANSAADDITALCQSDLEGWMAHLQAAPKRNRVHGHQNSTPAIRYRQIRAFYGWCVKEEILEVSPMRRMEEPGTVDTPVPVLGDDEIRALLKECSGKDFESRRDTAIIRLWCEPGSPRAAEMAGIKTNDLDLRAQMVTVFGKGSKVRVIPYGMKTGEALDRYLRLRSKHELRALPHLWLGSRGKEITPSGLQQMLRRRADRAGIGHVFPHQLRHSAYHAYDLAGGSQGSAMALFGWSSAAMPLHYGRSARDERARAESRRLSPADRL